MNYRLVWGLLVTVAQYACAYVWPAYSSFQAIESKNNLDDIQWLSYWIIFALFTTLEGIIWPALRFVPLYKEMKLAIFGWLALPQFNGGRLVYFRFRPYILKALAFVEAKLRGGESLSDKKEHELASLRAQIADVQDDLYSSLNTDYESVKASKMDTASLNKKIEQLRGDISAAASPISPVMPSPGDLPPADAAVKVSAQDSYLAKSS